MVNILLGDGKGGFAPPSVAGYVPPATGKNPDSVAVGDFNGDGIQDLAVADSNSNDVTILTGKGDGTFTAQSASVGSGATSPYSVAVADVNGDGWWDVVAADSGSGMVTAVLNSITTTATATLAGVAVPGSGSQSVVAGYTGDSLYAHSISSAVTLTGTPVSTTNALTVEPGGNIAAGETVQLTATIKPSVLINVPVSGTLTFYAGTTILNSSQGTFVPGAPVVFFANVSFPAAGTQSLSAQFVSSNANYTGSTSATVKVTVVATVGSITALTPSATSVTKGSVVTLTAAVTSGGQPITRGTVLFCNANSNFCEDGAVFGKAQLTAGGTAAIKIALPVGTNSVKAVFAGTALIAGSSSTAQTITVTDAYPTTISLSATGSAGQYTLTSVANGLSWRAVQGTISVVDTSNRNLPLGSTFFAFTTPVPVQFALSSMPAGGNPAAIVAADFNFDGKPDLIIGDGDEVGTVIVLLGNGDGTFTAKAPITGPGVPTGTAVQGIVVGDFKSDGKLDAAVTYGGVNVVLILLGNGDGTFTTQVPPSSFSFPTGLAVADFNGDGNLDLAVGNSAANNITILLGNGDGTFTADPVSPSTGASPGVIAAADFNGDGKMDLAIENGSGSVTILLGNGDGTFTTGTPPSTGPSPRTIIAADFNGDGKPDLAIADGTSNITILLNLGGGTFHPAPNPPQFPVAGMIGVAAGDFNGDGITDLALVSNYNYVAALLGHGDGTFQVFPAPAPGNYPLNVVVADFNGDAGPALAITQFNGTTAAIMLNQAVPAGRTLAVLVPGGGTHQLEATFTPSSTWYTPSVSNLVAVSGAQIATNTTVTASPGFAAPGQTVQFAVSVSPSSADNYTLTGTVSIYNGTTLAGTVTLVNGAGTFSTSLAGAGTYQFTAKYSGDTNFAASASAPTIVTVASASTTILVASPTSVASGTPVALTATVTSGGKPVTRGTVTFYNGATAQAAASLTSNGTASAKVVLGIGAHPVTAAFAANALALASSSVAQTITVTGVRPTTTTFTAALTSGTYTLAAKVSGAGTQAPTGTVSYLDTTANTTLGTATLSGAATTVTFAAQPAISTGLNPQTIVVADFNRDGIPDMAVSLAGTSAVTILLGNGHGGFTTKSTPIGPSGLSALAAGDFNSDGIPDLAVGSGLAATVYILLGNGDGTFTLKSSPATAAPPVAAAVADFNGDGRLDLAFADQGSSITVLLGNGDGTFSSSSFSPSGLLATTSIAAGDFNGDGIPDLVVTDYSSATATVLFGNGNGTS